MGLTTRVQGALGQHSPAQGLDFGGPMWTPVNSVILVGPFQLIIFYDNKCQADFLLIQLVQHTYAGISRARISTIPFKNWEQPGHERSRFLLQRHCDNVLHPLLSTAVTQQK